MKTDIQYGTYGDAERSAIEYLNRLADDKKWLPINNDPGEFKKQGRPEPDDDLIDQN